MVTVEKATPPRFIEENPAYAICYRVPEIVAVTHGTRQII